MKVYIDGQYYDKENASISVFDHGLLYGDGVFEGIRIYNGKVFKLKEHVLRLYASAKAILLEIPLLPPQLLAAVEEVVRLNEKTEGYIRVVVTRGRGDLGLDPGKCPRATVIIIVDDIALYPAELYERGISVVTAASRRLAVDGLDPRIKSLNYLNNILAKIEAKQAGCLEAVLLNPQGFICECTADNIFIIKDEILYTPDTTRGALDGITRRTVLDLAEGLSIPCRVGAQSRYDLYTADECFITGSGAEVMPVTSADGRSIGSGKPGRLTLKLRDEFRRFVAGDGRGVENNARMIENTV
jgi:branched-chain amino acid aminotransferase